MTDEVEGVVVRLDVELNLRSLLREEVSVLSMYSILGVLSGICSVCLAVSLVIGEVSELVLFPSVFSVHWVAICPFSLHMKHVTPSSMKTR